MAHADGASTDPKKAPAGAYQVETHHTQVLFAIPHLGITDYYGRFEKISGTLNFNPGAPEKSSVDISIDTSSVNVMSAELVGELAGAAVFDSAHFPTATLQVDIGRTHRLEHRQNDRRPDNPWRDEASDLRRDIQRRHASADWQCVQSGLSRHRTIKRSDFGLDKMMWKSFVGDDVKLIVEAMFLQQKS